MRTAKPGTWWVLRQKGAPLFFTGEMVEHRIGEQQLNVAVFSATPDQAQQCGDKAAAESVAWMFGIMGSVDPVQLEFAA